MKDTLFNDSAFNPGHYYRIYHESRDITYFGLGRFVNFDNDCRDAEFDLYGSTTNDPRGTFWLNANDKFIAVEFDNDGDQIGNDMHHDELTTTYHVFNTDRFVVGQAYALVHKGGKTNICLLQKKTDNELLFITITNGYSATISVTACNYKDYRVFD